MGVGGQCHTPAAAGEAITNHLSSVILLSTLLPYTVLFYHPD